MATNNSLLQRTITLKTPKHELIVNFYYCFAPLASIRVNKELFSSMCKTGCPNYDKKYSCPPLSPEFSKYIKCVFALNKDASKNASKILLILITLDIGQLKYCQYNEYHKLRMSNAMLKYLAEKVMRQLEAKFSTKFLSTGSCRLCRPCMKKLNKPCKQPDKMRYSLEALGVDCNKLAQDIFKVQLQWYKNKKLPEYTAVICGLPLDAQTSNSRVVKETMKMLDALQN